MGERRGPNAYFLVMPAVPYVGFLGGTVIKNPPANAGDARGVDFIPGSGRSAGEGSSVLAWKISWTEESGGLHSTGSQRVGHN